MRDRVFDVASTHTVSGNPGRFRQGSIEVRPDDDWIERLGPMQKITATALASPFLRRYGYSILTRSDHPHMGDLFRGRG